MHPEVNIFGFGSFLDADVLVLFWIPLTFIIWSKTFNIIQYQISLCVPQKKVSLRCSTGCLLRHVAVKYNRCHGNLLLKTKSCNACPASRAFWLVRCCGTDMSRAECKSWKSFNLTQCLKNKKRCKHNGLTHPSGKMQSDTTHPEMWYMRHTALYIKTFAIYVHTHTTKYSFVGELSL